MSYTLGKFSHWMNTTLSFIELIFPEYVVLASLDCENLIIDVPFAGTVSYASLRANEDLLPGAGHS